MQSTLFWLVRMVEFVEYYGINNSKLQLTCGSSSGRTGATGLTQSNEAIAEVTEAADFFLSHAKHAQHAGFP